MSKQIRLTDVTYIALDALREKRETFSEVVERIIRCYNILKDASDTLGPSHFLKERPVIDARAKETIDTRGNRPTLPDVPV